MRVRVLGAAALLFAMLGARAAERAAEIVSVQGQGESRPSESAPWKPATARQELFALEFVRTGAYSRMGLLFADQTQVRLAEKTVMQIKAAAPSPGQRTVIRLEQGRTWSQTNKTPSDLYLETPAATAAVRGTDWEVEVFDGGRSLITVLSGEVEFFNDQGRVTVAKNEQAQAIPGQAPVKLLIANPKSRVQWVTAYSIDPLRHIDTSGGPGAELSRLLGIAELVRADRLEEANARALDEIASGRATQPAAWLIASDLMVHQGRLERANDFVQQGLGLFRNDPRLVAQLARLSLAAGDLDAARAQLQPALSGTPASFDATLAAADLARASGDGAAARRGYEVARAQRPADARPWYGIGVVDSEREASASGRAHLKEALERDPRGAGYQGELGTLETFAWRLDDADRAFSAALAANPSDYVALTGLGVLQLKRGEREQALESFLRAGTLEPRYARARMYAGVANYQLGRTDLALRELGRASELDDKDPLPHLFASMILTDQYRISEAIAEARTAMRLLPYLKSLNQVANDLQGSANVGRSLSLFGLEEWAQAYAQESYFPYWAGSHLFLADRYQGEFNKNSALLQGFLADPTVFGAAPTLQSLVQVPGRYARALYGYAYSRDITLSSPILRANGLSEIAGVPVAYIVDGELQTFGHPDGNLPDDKIRSVTFGVGVRPTHELGLFLYGFNGREDDHFLTQGFDFVQRQKTTNLNVGAHYAFSPTSQLWVRAGRLEHSHTNDGTFLDEPFTSALDHRQPEYGLRHTFDAGRHQVTWGGEQAHKRLDDGFTSVPFENARIVTTHRFDERSRNAYVSDTADLTPRLRVQADAWWQDNRRTLDRVVTGYFLDEPVPGTASFEDQSQRKVTGRVGLRFKFSDTILLRAAWQDWLRPLGTSTLGPVATAGIPMDDRLVARGGRQERGRVQVEVEASPRTYLVAYADQKDIDNKRFTASPFFISEDENLFKLKSFDYGQLGAEDLYEFISAPEFDGARIRIGGAAWDQVLGRTLSMRMRYEYTDSRNTGPNYPGNKIAYLPRHAASIGLTWMSPYFIYMTQRAVYRTERFVDEANLAARKPGWDAAADWFWETRDKRWRVRFSLDNVFHKEKTTLYTLVLVANF